ncbi:sulfurtransferase [Celeribacter neptunius]|uniref:Sulfurtransferase n=1 Tax=Celeribacter neptunius TaxID=588602 RepID=A0A1I3U7H9_9RHOB|nr:rhodanese-like domain-containing protein [Celeribacter neptunius]SFJ79528.1 thiosulfate/3-mercaptopyruvate sulfurtransferase [Celeribacter neptunius]
MSDPLVTADWLARNLDQVIVLDATYYLPPDPAQSRLDFETTRIPGARLFEVDEIADQASDLPHMLPDEARFAAAMAELGIDGTKPVVVYDRSATHFSAPRVWYTLRLFGLNECYVLDGGLPLWIKGGHPVEAGACQNAAVAARDWTLARHMVLSGAELAERVAAGGETVIDARSQERFDGTAPEPRPGLSSGHMVGASCLPFPALTGEDGRFADVATLKELFAAVDGGAPIVTCGSGMTACVLALGLARLGLGARLYDGSWAEWGQDTLGAIQTSR